LAVVEVVENDDDASDDDEDDEDDDDDMIFLFYFIMPFISFEIIHDASFFLSSSLSSIVVFYAYFVYQVPLVVQAKIWRHKSSHTDSDN